MDQGAWLNMEHGPGSMGCAGSHHSRDGCGPEATGRGTSCVGAHYCVGQSGVVAPSGLERPRLA
eukprot:scaffold89327_cov78-Phaeocystis_antarctica.AAC.1